MPCRNSKHFPFLLLRLLRRAQRRWHSSQQLLCSLGGLDALQDMMIIFTFPFAIPISVGLAAGCIPVVGYNIGAGRKDRAKGLFTMLLGWEAAVGFIALLIAELLPRQLIGIFGAGNESAYYTAFAVRCFRIYLCMMVLAMVNKGTFIYLQALGKAVPSMALSMIREILFGVFLPILLPRFFGLDGILYSFPTADVLTFIFTVVVILNVFRELSTGNGLGKTTRALKGSA